ncbi:unnamed protein product [Musa acuminata subsp. burmannicoides]
MPRWMFEVGSTLNSFTPQYKVMPEYMYKVNTTTSDSDCPLDFHVKPTKRKRCPFDHKMKRVQKKSYVFYAHIHIEVNSHSCPPRFCFFLLRQWCDQFILGNSSLCNYSTHLSHLCLPALSLK